jgi:hypothetical protein
MEPPVTTKEKEGDDGIKVYFSDIKNTKRGRASNGEKDLDS